MNEPKLRSAYFERTEINTEDRTVPMSISSDSSDILRFVTGKGVGYERLMHDSLNNIDLTRFPSKRGGPLLVGHDRDAIVGRYFITGVENGQLRGYAKFGKSARANEAFQDVVDGVLCDTSISYEYDPADVSQDPLAQRDFPVYNIKRWTLSEASLVSVPADTRTGVGRAFVAADEKEPAGVKDSPAEDAAELCTDPNCTPEAMCADCKAGKSTPKKTEAAAPARTGLTSPIMEVPMETVTGSVDQTQNNVIEVLQLRSIAQNLGKGKEAEEILAAKPLAEARAAINALLASTPAPAVQNMDMSKSEAKQYSYARAIQNALRRMEGEKIGLTFEDEVAQTLERQRPANSKNRGGLLVPMQLRADAAGLDSKTSTKGAEGIYTTYGGELIELLKNYAAVMQAGARVMSGLNGPVSFPKQTADATCTWSAENSTDVETTQPAFGSVGLSPKLLLGATAFSRSLMMQSVFSIESVVRQSLASAHALAIDKAAIHGSGASNNPTGIYKITGTNTVAFGGVPTFAKLQSMITEVSLDNALAGNMSWITTPGIAGLLSSTLESSVAGAKYVWTGDRQNGNVCGYKAASTNQMSALMSTLDATGGSQHGILFGNFSDLLIGFWGSMELILDPYTLKKAGMIEVASHQLADVQVRHAQSFCVATGATLS